MDLLTRITIPMSVGTLSLFSPLFCGDLVLAVNLEVLKCFLMSIDLFSPLLCNPVNG